MFEFADMLKRNTGDKNEGSVIDSKQVQGSHKCIPTEQQLFSCFKLSSVLKKSPKTPLVLRKSGHGEEKRPGVTNVDIVYHDWNGKVSQELSNYVATTLIEQKNKSFFYIPCITTSSLFIAS